MPCLVRGEIPVARPPVRDTFSAFGLPALLASRSIINPHSNGTLPRLRLTMWPWSLGLARLQCAAWRNEDPVIAFADVEKYAFFVVALLFPAQRDNFACLEVMGETLVVGLFALDRKAARLPMERAYVSDARRGIKGSVCPTRAYEQRNGCPVDTDDFAGPSSVRRFGVRPARCG